MVSDFGFKLQVSSIRTAWLRRIVIVGSFPLMLAANILLNIACSLWNMLIFVLLGVQAVIGSAVKQW